MYRAMRAIQKIIQVMRPTAMIDSVPPMASCASKLSPLGPKVRSAPKPIETAAANATPAQTTRTRSRRSVLTR